MISEPTTSPVTPAADAATPRPDQPRPASPWLGALAAVVAVVALIACAMLWNKLSGIQEQLARQSADAGAQAAEARGLARKADDLSRETAARMSVNDTRLSEVALQRSQLEELMQSLSRSRDENLVVDIESGVRLAQQQAALTSSAEPLLAALQTAHQRIERSAQPRLAPLQRAIDRDIERVKATSITDVGGLLARIDDLIRAVDALPTHNAVAQSNPTGRFSVAALDRVRTGTNTANTASTASTARRADLPASIAASAADTGNAATDWWRRSAERVWDAVWAEARGLVRVSRIDQPDAALVSPEQTFFLRENLKHKLVSARLGILARQTDSARADLAAAADALTKYFDPESRRVQAAAGTLRQVAEQTRSAELPAIDETLSALATAAAGR